MKLDIEIAVDQQTKAHDRTFEGILDFGYTPVPAGQPRPYLVNLVKSPEDAHNHTLWCSSCS